jgi:hypothetical protein
MAVAYAAGMNFGVAAALLFDSESDGLGQSMSVHSSALPSNSPFECHRTGRTYSRRCCCSPTVATNPRFGLRTTTVAVCDCLPLPPPSAMEAGSSAALCLTAQPTFGPMHRKMPNVDREPLRVGVERKRRGEPEVGLHALVGQGASPLLFVTKGLFVSGEHKDPEPEQPN